MKSLGTATAASILILSLTACQQLAENGDPAPPDGSGGSPSEYANVTESTRYVFFSVEEDDAALEGRVCNRRVAEIGKIRDELSKLGYLASVDFVKIEGARATASISTEIGTAKHHHDLRFESVNESSRPAMRWLYC